MFKGLFFSFFVFTHFIVSGSFAQEKPVGKFLKNTIKIGEPIQYTLSFRYPVDKEVLFPDSTYSFAPFEFIEKKYFKTISDSTTSFDSVVYTLSTFEIDPIQSLALPVFFIKDEDSTKVFANDDSITLVEVVPHIPDSVKLMENTTYVKVEEQFNYSYWLIGMAIFLLIIVLSILIFGKAVLKNIRLKRLKKQYEKFIKTFAETSQRINQENFQTTLLDTYSLWKKYIQGITNRPFTTYSTKEIFAIIKNEDLKRSLNNLDKGIYAGRYPEDLNGELKVLLNYAKKFYNQKLMEVRHGARK